MEVIYCKKCHERKRLGNFEDTLRKINNLENVSSVRGDCISYCGPGKKEFFSLVDDELVSGTTLEDLINNIKEFE